MSLDYFTTVMFREKKIALSIKTSIPKMFFVTIPWNLHTSYAPLGDVIMGAIASQITGLTIVYSPFIQTQMKENIKAPRHWPLCGEFTGDR